MIEKDAAITVIIAGAPASVDKFRDCMISYLTANWTIFETAAGDLWEADGLVHLTAPGETSWHGFASAIINGLPERGITLAVEQIVPIRTDEYPTRAKRPHNSRLDLSRWRTVFGQVPPHWETALAPVLDEFAHD
jgi:dTDP-4-dehydrorhamnose reductase